MIIYVGCFVEPSQENYICNVAHASRVISIDSFQKMFLSGFKDKNIKFDYIINAPEIGSFPKRSKSLRVPPANFELWGMKGKNVGFYNITYFKRYSIAYCIKKEIEKFVSKLDAKEMIIIVVCTLYYQYLKPLVDLKRKYSNVKICPIVLDLPEFLGDHCHKGRLSHSIKKVYQLVDEVDSFVLLTRNMSDRLGKNKPYYVMEGVYDSSKIINSISKKHNKTIMYSGTFDGRYGIKNLINSFMKIKDSDATLWLCGDGSEREYVMNALKRDSRIKYFGILSQQRVFEMQREASLLINPRKPEGEYTKYSFPSKTMEYMASGTPTLMYRLPGMPEEYIPYVLLFKDSTDEEMTRMMEEWLNKPQEELDAFGDKARKFILENKTAEKQVARFVEFIKDNYGG